MFVVVFIIKVFFKFNAFYSTLFQDPISSIESSKTACDLINFKPNLIINIMAIVRKKTITAKAIR